MAQRGVSLNGPLAAQILYDTGTAWAGTKRIGRRPNLVAARTLLLQGIGVIAGTVRDQASGDPIADADVRLLEPIVLVRTDTAGHYSAPVLSGTYTVRASDFFHSPDEQAVTVAAGQTLAHDITLALRPAGDLAGVVFTQLGDRVPDARVEILDAPIPPAATTARGSFLIGGIPAAAGYDVVCGLVPGLGAAARTVNVAADDTTSANAILVPAETFEASGAGYTPSTLWQWGAPSLVGPPSAFSGTRLWATALAGNYPDDVTATLTSASFDFGGATGLFLSFTHWYDIEAGFDGGQVQAWNGSAWVVVEPFGGYPLSFLAGLGYGSGYSGVSGGWRPAVFDLTPYISSDVRVRFLFGSDPGVYGPGWYIDDVAFDVRSGAVAVAPPVRAPAVRLLAARPNPFPDAITLAFGLPSPALVALRVFDASGRLVREIEPARFEAGAHALRWDGRDASGRAVASGAYFATLVVDGRAIGSRRVMLVR